MGTLHAIRLLPGAQWPADLTVEEVALGPLMPHNEEIEARFAAGELLANAFHGGGGGLYLYDADVVSAQELADTDPAIAEDILAFDSSFEWTLFFENLGVDLDDEDQTYLLEYGLGSRAMPGAALVEQDIQGHTAYFAAFHGEDRLLAGGLTSPTSALYLIAAPDDVAAAEIIANDPAVIDGTLEATAVVWGNPPPFPQHFHRRSLGDTRAVQE